MGIQEAIAEVQSWTTYRLASEAECGNPDNLDSPGAQMLDSVRRDTLERIGYATDSDGVIDFELLRDEAVFEIGDSAPSVYNYPRWQEFVDLAAWQEDIDESGKRDDGTIDMTEQAGIALSQIAERLVNAILDFIEADD